MLIKDIISQIPEKIATHLHERNLQELRPCQYKAIQAGLFEQKNILICTPTASGKTLVGEMAFLQATRLGKKALYIVPLKALANEKFGEFTARYPQLRVAKSIGDSDSAQEYLASYDVIVTTTEKVDSLLRHQSSWIHTVGVSIIDEIHLLNDASRGPTLEIVITILRQLLGKNMQLIGLSATIGNAQELASWLQAELVLDTWRPAKLHHAIYEEGTITYHRTQE